MKRKLWAAAVAGLVACGAVVSQDGRLAPTAPIVPAPVMGGGGVRAPAAGNWGGGGRAFAANNWSPLRSPVAPAAAEVPPVPAHSGYAVPPLAGGSCAPSCGPATGGRGDRSCWDKFKAWMCFAPSKTELPKLRPTPYVTPLQGMFYCSTPAGCAPCAAGAAPVYAPPAITPPGPTMPTPMPPPKIAGPVVMPPRAQPGAPPPRAQPGTLPGTVVPAGFKALVK